MFLQRIERSSQTDPFTEETTGTVQDNFAYAGEEKYANQTQEGSESKRWIFRCFTRDSSATDSECLEWRVTEEKTITTARTMKKRKGKVVKSLALVSPDVLSDLLKTARDCATTVLAPPSDARVRKRVQRKHPKKTKKKVKDDAEDEEDQNRESILQRPIDHR